MQCIFLRQAFQVTNEPIHLSEVNQPKAAFAQDSLDPVATDVLRCWRSNLVHGCWLLRACPVEVVHGQSLSCPVLFNQGALYPLGVGFAMNRPKITSACAS